MPSGRRRRLRRGSGAEEMRVRRGRVRKTGSLGRGANPSTRLAAVRHLPSTPPLPGASGERATAPRAPTVPGSPPRHDGPGGGGATATVPSARTVATSPPLGQHAYAGPVDAELVALPPL